MPLQQDIRMIDYLQEFGEFIGKKQLSAKQKEFALTRGQGSAAVRDGRAPGDGGMTMVIRPESGEEPKALRLERFNDRESFPEPLWNLRAFPPPSGVAATPRRVTAGQITGSGKHSRIVPINPSKNYPRQKNRS